MTRDYPGRVQIAIEQMFHFMNRPAADGNGTRRCEAEAT
jgi:hypothetical protein